MKTSAPHPGQVAGSTLPEVLIAAAVAAIILGGLMVGSIALQRSFSASDRLARAQADLLRVSDYIARDIRNAKTLDATPSSTVLLTLTTGDYYNRNGTPKNLADDVANTPIIGRSGATYGTNPVTIRYLRSDNRILREVSRVDSGITSTTSTWIADNVNDLRVNVDAGGTATVTSSSTMPYATRKAGAGAPAISFVMASQPRNPNP